jgi:hypothetical protein
MGIMVQTLVGDTYSAPALAATEPEEVQFGVAAFVATIAVILAFFVSTAAWCWFVCRNNGGTRSCSVGWFTAKATCRR